MRKLITFLAILSISFSQQIELNKGWNLIGAENSIILSEFKNFKEINAIWTYLNGNWKKWNKEESDIDFILSGDGFWIDLNEATSLLIGDNTHKDIFKYQELEDGSFVISCFSPIEKFNSILIDNEDITNKIDNENYKLFGNENFIVFHILQNTIYSDELYGKHTVSFELMDGTIISKKVQFPDEFGELYIASIDGYLYGYDSSNKVSDIEVLSNFIVKMTYTNDGLNWQELNTTTDEKGWFEFKNLTAITISLFAKIGGIYKHFYSRTDTTPIPESYHLGQYMIDYSNKTTNSLKNVEDISNELPWLLSGKNSAKKFFYFKQGIPNKIEVIQSTRKYIYDQLHSSTSK